ncbi:hypothetical protein L9F63_015510 [Diploptera punctata]|uniref:BTB domain-containing protein n=1 Tax=Diploptera punctata TaxID=6984 RepID=A0AAD8A5H0_DIPPU|nr:hypothetical protein L9F63_015510 [Diploptera punctata]
MARRERRRLCKFIWEWTTSDEFSSWLTPVKGEKHKGYCLLCQKVFAVSHGGLNDVKAHYKGKRHIWLQQEYQERVAGQSKEGHVDPKTKRIVVFNEQTEELEETVINPDTLLNIEEDILGYDSSRTSDADYWPLLGLEANRNTIEEPNSNQRNMNSQHKMLPQQYCLRWKYHHNNLQVMFSQLLERESFCDVTLACEGKTLRAHKVVLSACSTYFDAIFSQYEENNPIVILKDVKFTDIKALVEFMYRGEINIDHSHLASLLKTAEDLRIKGLAEDHGDRRVKLHSSVETHKVRTLEYVGNGSDLEPPLKRRRGRPPMETNVYNFSPKVASVTGAGGAEDVFMQESGATGASDVENEVPPWDESEPEVIPCDSGETTSHQPANALPNDPNYNENESENNMSSASGIFEGSTMSGTMYQMLADKYRDVIKLNDYLTTGRRQQFWEEPFTRRIMEAIKSKELEMKAGAELLGVSYGTLYGRYRDAYGCLKHPYRVRDFWSESGPADVLARVQRKEITLFRAAEMLNVTVTTLANYLSTLRRGGSSSGDEGGDDGRDDDAFDDVTMSMVSSSPKKLATAALENNPDITIVKQENTVQISNHEQEDDDESQPSSVATNNNADNSENEMREGQESNETTQNEEEK